MSKIFRHLKHRVMGVADDEATGFSRGDSDKWRHLETAVRTAVGGYHLVLDDSRGNTLIPRLDEVELQWRGYAYEGAAMGLTGLDCFLPTRSRFQEYVAGPGRKHAYMAHIGAGEALARLRRRPEPFLNRLPHPVLRWLVMDGYGFHEGFFRPDRHVIAQRVPGHLGSDARRVFDQGVGRAIWFVAGADINSIHAILTCFPEQRHADLWHGIGVACGYVGGVSELEINELGRLSGDHRQQLAVGAAFVAKGRAEAGNMTADTELASQILCGHSADTSARLVDEGFAAVGGTRSSFAYGELQVRLAGQLASPAAESGGVRS